MVSNFYKIIDDEVKIALPPDWKRIPSDKLLGKEPYKIRHAFHSSRVDNKSKLINILVLPLSLRLDGNIESQLIKLRDYILSRDCLFIVINEEEEAGSLADIGQFIEENLFIDNPNFLWIICSRDKGYKTSIEWQAFEDLNMVIHDLWDGTLHYAGPKIGLQQVNLELIQDNCWKCNKIMKTVTGVVFPNKQLRYWNNVDWLYYNQLLPLSKLDSNNIQLIQQYVAQLRMRDAIITPLGDRYSHTVQESYFAASCPHCNALRGDFHVADYRMQFLHSLKSRINGQLEYHSIQLEIDQELINTLRDGYESCNHTCGIGWERE